MSTPFSEDALNRYRITHSDRELKPLHRRLHRLSSLALFGPADEPGEAEADTERYLVQLEILKWRSGIARVVGSVANLERETENYKAQSSRIQQETLHTGRLLENEKHELARARARRDYRARCDDLAAQIQARSARRDELDGRISALEQSLEEQRASHAVYVETAQARAALFSRVATLIDECRGLKLPADASLVGVAPGGGGGGGGGGDKDPEVGAAHGHGIRLNAAAPTFQPIMAAPVISAVAGTTPFRSPSPSIGHSLPSRPPASASASTSTSARGAPPAGRQGSYALPNRPMRGSALAKGGSHGKGRTGLEDGEVGPEEGEVDERSAKRSAEGDSMRRNMKRRM